MNNEEQLKVLQMVADGVVTVEEGEQLLETLEKSVQSESYVSTNPLDFSKDFENDGKQAKMDKKREKEYQKHLKRMQKAQEKSKQHVSMSTHTKEDRLTRAADELAQKAVDKALERIEKEVEGISNSIFE